METISLFEKSIVLVVILSAPPLVVAIGVGVLISLIQTVFQIQDQTLPFAIKLIAVTATLAMVGTWMGGEIALLTESVFTAMPDVGKW